MILSSPVCFPDKVLLFLTDGEPGDSQTNILATIKTENYDRTKAPKKLRETLRDQYDISVSKLAAESR